MKKLNLLEDIVNKATPGPWHWKPAQGDCVPYNFQTNHITRDVWYLPKVNEDAQLIAALNPVNAKLLIEVIKKQREALEEIAKSEVNLEVKEEQRYIAWAHWCKDTGEYALSETDAMLDKLELT